MNEENFIKKSKQELANTIQRIINREEEARKKREHILKKQKESIEDAD